MFNQSPPRLRNQYEDDAALRGCLRRLLPPEVLRAIEPELLDMGARAGDELYALQRADRLNEPRHTPWDAWGNRIDHVALTPLWQVCEPLAARAGLVAAGHEPAHGRWSRAHQFALVYLFTPSSDLYSCPLAMTDGAATALAHSGNAVLKARALPHLMARDPAQFWTSGQWMTESTGGSDVGLSETLARRDANGSWRLHGRKWFTSSVASQMALTLARPEGNPAGGKGLALFFVQVRDAQGRLNGITVNRLKDKLGTRKVPTAELMLEGTLAEPVAGLADGVRHMAPMLNITRTWNSVSSVAYMRRALALARDYADRRLAFGALLRDKPLHRDTLEGMQAEFDAALQLTFHLVECLGRVEAGEGGGQALLRLLTPIVKLTTAKQCVSVCSEALECFGGAGYVEDTGLPALLRDAQVFPIWEGTTNVLSLEALRAARGGALEALSASVSRTLAAVRAEPLLAAASAARACHDAALNALARADADAVERDARRIALGIGRGLALALLCAHAQWCLDQGWTDDSVASARRFAARLHSD